MLHILNIINQPKGIWWMFVEFLHGIMCTVIVIFACLHCHILLFFCSRHTVAENHYFISVSFFFVALAHELVVHLKNCIFLFEIHFSMGHSAYIYIFICSTMWTCRHARKCIFMFAHQFHFVRLRTDGLLFNRYEIRRTWKSHEYAKICKWDSMESSENERFMLCLLLHNFLFPKFRGDVNSLILRELGVFWASENAGNGQKVGGDFACCQV